MVVLITYTPSSVVNAVYSLLTEAGVDVHLLGNGRVPTCKNASKIKIGSYEDPSSLYRFISECLKSKTRFDGFMDLSDPYRTGSKSWPAAQASEQIRLKVLEPLHFVSELIKFKVLKWSSFAVFSSFQEDFKKSAFSKFIGNRLVKTVVQEYWELYPVTLKGTVLEIPTLNRLGTTEKISEYVKKLVVEFESSGRSNLLDLGDST
jgi:hypothetical protein